MPTRLLHRRRGGSLGLTAALRYGAVEAGVSNHGRSVHDTAAAWLHNWPAAWLGLAGMPFRAIAPEDLEWITRPHEPGEPARHVAELSEAPGAAHVRANIWRYEPGAHGRRHRHTEQEETFVVLSGTLTMLIGDRRNASRSQSVGWSTSPRPHRCKRSTTDPRISSSTPTGTRRTRVLRF